MTWVQLYHDTTCMHASAVLGAVSWYSCRAPTVVGIKTCATSHHHKPHEHRRKCGHLGVHWAQAFYPLLYRCSCRCSLCTLQLYSTSSNCCTRLRLSGTVALVARLRMKQFGVQAKFSNAFIQIHAFSPLFKTLFCLCLSGSVRSIQDPVLHTIYVQLYVWCPPVHATVRVACRVDGAHYSSLWHHPPPCEAINRHITTIIIIRSSVIITEQSSSCAHSSHCLRHLL